MNEMCGEKYLRRYTWGDIFGFVFIFYGINADKSDFNKFIIIIWACIQLGKPIFCLSPCTTFC